MNHYINIIAWDETKRIQANKPTKWQKFLSRLRLIKLPAPKYWIEAKIKVECPHSLHIGDIILARNLQLYHVMQLSYISKGTETYKISSSEPVEQSSHEIGKTIIIATACPSEFTKPFIQNQ